MFLQRKAAKGAKFVDHGWHGWPRPCYPLKMNASRSEGMKITVDFNPRKPATTGSPPREATLELDSKVVTLLQILRGSRNYAGDFDQARATISLPALNLGHHYPPLHPFSAPPLDPAIPCHLGIPSAVYGPRPRPKSSKQPLPMEKSEPDPVFGSQQHGEGRPGRSGVKI